MQTTQNQRNAKMYRTTSLKYVTENTNFKVNNVSCQKEDSINNETNEKLNEIWDVAMKDTNICNVHEQGYDLHGIDFKMLEIFQREKPGKIYQREKPGWLNDNIIDAYLKILTKSSLVRGKRIFAFFCLFYLSLKKAVRSRNIDKLYRIVSKSYKSEIFESYDFMLCQEGKQYCENYNRI